MGTRRPRTTVYRKIRHEHRKEPAKQVSVSPIMATTSEDHQAASQLERVRRYQVILNDFGRAASETKLLGQLLHLACVQAARGIGIKHTKVLRYRPSKGDLLVDAGVGWKPGVVGQTTFGTDIASPPGRALQSRQPVRIDDLPNNPEFRYPPSLREQGIVSVLNVPVTVDAVLWGVLEVDSETPRDFSQDDIVFLSAMANILGLALGGMLHQKLAEDTAARAVREAERQKMLMRELAHRDKNDFQMVISILLMQMSKQDDEQAVRGFKHAIDSVSAISMAHDQLAMRPDQPTIDVATYLEALCGNLRHRGQDIAIETKLDRAELTHERAVSLGLITNELVTNALKYAFPDGKGTVRVEFTADQEIGQGCLVVADDGVGMGKPREGSSGLRLVH
ncbi:GAF domain-containing protein [Azospirillum brasilense]|nr:GAF domain-containing protein [Azospirillum brasilense]NUB33619.1 GAF domain-containing protein [Azospirillum brasilense]RIW00360.1 GAF domain-containing protein [Azospirillum brasilense]